MNKLYMCRRDLVAYMLYGTTFAYLTAYREPHAQETRDNFSEALSISRDMANVGMRLRPAQYPMSDSQASFWRELDFHGRLVLSQAAVECLTKDLLQTFLIIIPVRVSRSKKLVFV